MEEETGIPICLFCSCVTATQEPAASELKCAEESIGSKLFQQL